MSDDHDDSEEDSRLLDDQDAPVGRDVVDCPCSRSLAAGKADYWSKGETEADADDAPDADDAGSVD